MEIDKGLMQDLCDDAEIDVRWDYSGRFMYGKICFGIVGNSRDLTRFLLEVLPCYYEQKSDTGDNTVPAKWHENVRDSMGLDMIFYWPGIVAAPEKPAEDAHPADVKYDRSDPN